MNPLSSRIIIHYDETVSFKSKDERRREREKSQRPCNVNVQSVEKF